MRTVALLGGGDWNDASVDHLDVPDSMDIKEVEKEWRSWYDSFYLPNFRSGNKPEYKSIVDFMLEKGAVRSKIEEYSLLD